MAFMPIFHSKPMTGLIINSPDKNTEIDNSFWYIRRVNVVEALYFIHSRLTKEIDNK